MCRRSEANSPTRAQSFFGLTVGTKVNRARRCNADDVRSQPFEQRSRTFRLHDVFEALENAHRLGGRRNAAVRNRVHLKRQAVHSRNH